MIGKISIDVYANGKWNNIYSEDTNFPATYQEEVIDLTDYDDEAEFNIRFILETVAAANWMVDDVKLEGMIYK